MKKEEIKQAVDECFSLLMKNIKAVNEMKNILKQRSWNGEVYLMNQSTKNK